MRNDSVYSSMTLEPLRSALSIGEVGETSLALPSDRSARSAQQRVLEQVSTMKRSKSKYSSGGGAGGGKAGGTGNLSPTSPQSDSVFYEYKLTPSALNGFINENSMSNGHAKAAKQGQSFVQRTISTRTSSSQKNLSNSMFPSSPTAMSHSRGGQEGFTAFRSLEMSSPPAVSGGNARWSQTFRQTNRQTLERKHSQGALNSNSQIIGNGFGNGIGSVQMTGNGFGSGQVIGSSQMVGNGQVVGNGQMFGNGQVIGNGTIHRNSSGSNHQITTSQIISRRPPSTHSNPEGVKASVASRSKSEIGVNGEARSTDLTVSEAVDCLLSQDENYQLCGASFIQHTTYTDDKAKQEVLKMKGINPLVSLMNSPNPQIQMTAASALRNLVFKDPANKEEVQRCGGIGQAVQLLKNTESPETQKHVTGLLWNLSSADNLKPELLRSALPVLTDTVLEPFAAADHSASADQEETFYNATGCLRNLSSGKLGSRQAMRNCKGLVDSLVSYVQNSVDSGNPDDKSVENCVCILHNLTYQLESESPAIFSKMNALAGYTNRRANTTDTGPIGCFSSQSRKIQQENHFDYPVMEDNNPKGQSWLIHSQALQSYLSLLGSSQREATQEACCGALHNLTANKGIVSDVLSQTIVQKLNGLQYISPLLQSSNPELKNSVTSLLGNLSRTPRLQSMMARQALPQLVRTLNSQGADLSPESDSSIATACHTVNKLLRAEPEMSKQLLSNTLINSLNDISQNIALPKASKASGVLLHSLWSDKNIQSFLKKQGMNKKSFVNDITSAAIKSVQVIE
ncbi:plakophilin-1 [Astyanax mexicanus]|uniref:plakophilin-1 n=1 Tax=Astyanax mexicanus TaxID=7994 RepID=UPI0020CB0DDF|nr:plakophilin-1 [Astyanax mexicanus]